MRRAIVEENAVEPPSRILFKRAQKKAALGQRAANRAAGKMTVCGRTALSQGREDEYVKLASQLSPTDDP
jgi:hypothetical protein